MHKIEEMLGLKSGELADILIGIGIKIAIALGILVIGFWMAKLLSKAVVRILRKRDTDESLIGFLRSLTSMGD